MRWYLTGVALVERKKNDRGIATRPVAGIGDSGGRFHTVCIHAPGWRWIWTPLQKSVVVDDWVPCPRCALGGGGAAPNPDFEEFREPRRGISVLSHQRGAGAGVRLGAVAQGEDKDDVPPLEEAAACAERALDSHPLLVGVGLRDLATDFPPHQREAQLREAHQASLKGAQASLACLLSKGQ
jgi:hypothetical protein